MPYCPECREEFDSGVQVCVDCGDVALVARLEDLPAQEPAPLPGAEHIEGELRFYADSRELAQRLEASLVSGTIPVFTYEEPLETEGGQAWGLAVPSEFEERAWARLRAVPYEEVDLGEGPVRLYSLDLEADDPVPEVLLAEDSQVLASGEAAHPALVEAALDTGSAHQGRAVRLLAESGPAGKALLFGILQEALKNRRREFLSVFLIQLRTIRIVPPEGGFEDLVAHEDVEVRRLACAAAASLLGRGFAPRLVGLLEDADAGVRDEAIEALFDLYGDDLGFEAEADEGSRAKAVGRWRQRVAR